MKDSLKSVGTYQRFQKKQEQRRVAVGPGNAHCMSIRQLSLRCGCRCCSCYYCSAAAAAAAATGAAVYRQFDD